MTVVEPEADLLVLTETGYGKRVALAEFRRKHRGGQGVRLIALEGKKTGLVAAVQQVTEEDEELLLISAGGQVIRTETNSINRYSSRRPRRDRHAPRRGRPGRRDRRLPRRAGGAAMASRTMTPPNRAAVRPGRGRRRVTAS